MDGFARYNLVFCISHCYVYRTVLTAQCLPLSIRCHQCKPLQTSKVPTRSSLRISHWLIICNIFSWVIYHNLLKWNTNCTNIFDKWAPIDIVDHPGRAEQNPGIPPSKSHTLPSGFLIRIDTYLFIIVSPPGVCIFFLFFFCFFQGTRRLIKVTI